MSKKLVGLVLVGLTSLGSCRRDERRVPAPPPKGEKRAAAAPEDKERVAELRRARERKLAKWARKRRKHYERHGLQHGLLFADDFERPG